jgi:hypothetical protein
MKRENNIKMVFKKLDFHNLNWDDPVQDQGQWGAFICFQYKRISSSGN